MFIIVALAPSGHDIEAADMETELLAAALEREHHEIDDGIEAFAAVDPSAKDQDEEQLRRAIRALRRHIYLEEEFIFPALHKAGMAAPVFVMLREHAGIWTTLDVLERQLDAGAADGTELDLCHKLAVQLQHHNLKEEKILYPQVDQVLTASQTVRLREFLDTGELPHGWVCYRARP